MQLHEQRSGVAVNKKASPDLRNSHGAAMLRKPDPAVELRPMSARSNKGLVSNFGGRQTTLLPGEMHTSLLQGAVPSDVQSSSGIKLDLLSRGSSKSSARAQGGYQTLDPAGDLASASFISPRPRSSGQSSSSSSSSSSSFRSGRKFSHSGERNIEMWTQAAMEPISPAERARKPPLGEGAASSSADLPAVGHGHGANQTHDRSFIVPPQHPLPISTTFDLEAMQMSPDTREAKSEDAVGCQETLPPASEAEIEFMLHRLGKCTSVLAILDEGAQPPTVLSFPARGLVDWDGSALSNLLLTPRCLAGLRSLNLGHNRLGDASAAALARALSQGAPELRCLVLHENCIGGAGMAALANAFNAGGLDRLEQIHLNFNRIGDEGVLAIVHACRDGGAPSLAELQLVANGIGDSGLAAMAAHLHGMPSLRKLTLGSSIGGNDIGDEGVLELAQALRLNGSRELSINLKSNPRITRAGIDALTSAEKDCNSILAGATEPPFLLKIRLDTY